MERNDCAHDGRGIYAILTQKGYDAFEAAAGPHIDGVRRLFFDRLDGWDDVLRRLLHQLAPEKGAAKTPA